jgi:hypothetical protein
MVAGEDETWRQIELIDVDSDGDVDLVRIQMSIRPDLVRRLTEGPAGTKPHPCAAE